mmetsp:Transcript_31690/g.74565  ORF Transcript_31690/g.74565 Transcript_31690/m.74565 type:complete len:637 (-) Transcript_31690:323-2233(-)
MRTLTSFFEFDPHECFLLLDDVVPEDLTPTHRKINLKEEEGDRGETRDRMSSVGRDAPGSVNNRSQNINNMTRLSLGGLSVTRMERNNSFTNGNISSQQQQRALLGILNNGSLRLMSGHCDVRDDGVLLMPGSQCVNSKNHNGGNFAEVINNPDNSLNGRLQNAISCRSPSEEGMDSGPRNLFDNCYIGDACEDHCDGPGFIMNDDSDNDGDVNMPCAHSEQSVEGTCALASSQHSSTKRVAFADSVEDDLQKKHKRQQTKKQKKDPWRLLDPHYLGDSSYTPKPLRRGKTYRLPGTILQPPSECVTGSSTTRSTKPERRSIVQQTLRPSLAIENFRVTMGKQLEPSQKISYRGLAYGDEFLYIAKENARLKASKRREERKREQRLSTAAPGEGEKKKGNFCDDNNTDYDDVYDDGDNGDGFNFGGGENDYHDEDYHNHTAGNSGLVDLEDAFGNRNINQYDGIQHQDSSNGQSFEELCRAHIQAFAKSAEKFALTTKLTERISHWQAHLAPILEEEERKASFDIHRYSDMLLESSIEAARQNKRKSMDENEKVHKEENLNKNANSVEFRSVAEGCSQSDVCRLFLASLSLANSGNLHIEEGALEYRFEILSTKVDRPMETYRAPSSATSSSGVQN